MESDQSRRRLSRLWFQVLPFEDIVFWQLWGFYSPVPFPAVRLAYKMSNLQISRFSAFFFFGRVAILVLVPS